MTPFDEARAVAADTWQKPRPRTLDELMPSMIDAWVDLDGKEGKALTNAEDSLTDLALMVVFAINRRQAERGVFCEEVDDD